MSSIRFKRLLSLVISQSVSIVDYSCSIFYSIIDVSYRSVARKRTRMQRGVVRRIKIERIRTEKEDQGVDQQRERTRKETGKIKVFLFSLNGRKIKML